MPLSLSMASCNRAADAGERRLRSGKFEQSMVELSVVHCIRFMIKYGLQLMM